MDESISRAAGASHGQEMPPDALEAIARRLGRMPRQRTTLYTDAPAERVTAARTGYDMARPRAASGDGAGLLAVRDGSPRVRRR